MRRHVGWRNESYRHGLAARGIKTSGVRITTSIPSRELSDVQLIQRVKAMYPGEDRQSLYGRYVQERGLRPTIDAKEFLEIYDSVSPEMHIEYRDVDFKPTHRVRNTGELVMIQMRKDGGYDLVFEDGSTGSNPPFMKVDDYFDALGGGSG